MCNVHVYLDRHFNNLYIFLSTVNSFTYSLLYDIMKADWRTETIVLNEQEPIANEIDFSAGSITILNILRTIGTKFQCLLRANNMVCRTSSFV